MWKILLVSFGDPQVDVLAVHNIMRVIYAAGVDSDIVGFHTVDGLMLFSSDKYTCVCYN